MMALLTSVNCTGAKFGFFESVKYASSITAHWVLPFYVGIRRHTPRSEYHIHCLYEPNIMHDGFADIGQLYRSKNVAALKALNMPWAQMLTGGCLIKRNFPGLENDYYCLYKLNIVHDGLIGIGQLSWSTIWHYVLRGQHFGIKCLLKVLEAKRWLW